MGSLLPACSTMMPCHTVASTNPVGRFLRLSSRSPAERLPRPAYQAFPGSPPVAGLGRGWTCFRGWRCIRGSIVEKVSNQGFDRRSEAALSLSIKMKNVEGREV